LARGRPEALGNHAQGQRMAEHLVVPGEIAHRQQVDTGLLLQLPVLGTQPLADRTQAGFIQLALPVRLKGFFQFTVATDARETEGMGQGHDLTLHNQSRWRHSRDRTSVRQTQDFRLDLQIYSCRLYEEFSSSSETG